MTWRTRCDACSSCHKPIRLEPAGSALRGASLAMGAWSSILTGNGRPCSHQQVQKVGLVYAVLVLIGSTLTVSY